MSLSLTEIRRRVIESVDPNLLNGIEETISFPYVSVSIPLKGVSSIFEFASKQVEGWEKLGEHLPPELKASKTYFQRIINSIEEFILNYSNQGGVDLTYYWKNVKILIRNTQSHPMKWNCPQVAFLLEVSKNYPLSFPSAFRFVTDASDLRVQSKDSMIGAILAYEFTSGDSSKISKRSVAEKNSTKNIKNDLERYFSDAESELVDHLRNANLQFSDYVAKIDNLVADQKQSVEKWFSETKDEFLKFNTNSCQNVKSLEKTYEELLSLKKPAEYWKTRGVELKKEGSNYLRWLIFLVVLTCSFLFSLLWLTPEEMLRSFFKEDKSLAIRWAIILITFISFMAYGIKALTKVTFSTFHLSRDAEERERLTYVYLAMVKESSVDKEDRHLIMQSLFSRADTGLLKDDSSPTMPGASGILDKFIK